jgi:hypothetical protein
VVFKVSALRSASTIICPTRQREEGFPNFSEGNPSPAEGNPNSAEGNQRKILGFPSPNRALSRTYADPHGLFLFQAVSGLKGAAAAYSLPAVLRSFRFRFGSSRFRKQVKGWRRFDRETLGRHLRRPVGREP